MLLNYINSFRGIAILFIVAGHSIEMFNYKENEMMGKLLSSTFCNGTVLFVFIAGFLFQHLSLKYDFYRYMKKKITNVILPYFIVSIPAILAFVLRFQKFEVVEGFYDKSLPNQVISLYLTGDHLDPLWFIPMITLYYLISPILIIGDKNKIYYLLPIFLVISVLFPRLEGNPILPNSLHFFSVYLFGMFYAKYKETMFVLTDKFLIVLGFLYLATLLLPILEIGQNFSMNYFNKMLACVLFTFYLHKYEEIIKDRLDLFASFSFGIYFIHWYVIYAVKYLFISNFGFKFEGNLLDVAGFFTIVFAMCCLIVLVIKRLLKEKSRYFIGS